MNRIIHVSGRRYYLHGICKDWEALQRARLNYLNARYFYLRLYDGGYALYFDRWTRG